MRLVPIQAPPTLKGASARDRSARLLRGLPRTTLELAAVNPAEAVVRSMRPRQWVKNVLVVAAPVAAGDIGEPGVLGATAIAFVSFCLASSAVYLVNDCVDREADRVHPRKRFRPIAAGELSVGVAVAVAVVLAGPWPRHSRTPRPGSSWSWWSPTSASSSSTRPGSSTSPSST